MNQVTFLPALLTTGLTGGMQEGAAGAGPIGIKLKVGGVLVLGWPGLPRLPASAIQNHITTF